MASRIASQIPSSASAGISLAKHPRELTLIGLRGADNPVDLMVGHLHDLANPPAPVKYLPSLGGCHEFMTIDGIDITAAGGDADVQLPTHEEFVEETMMRKNDNNRHPMHQLFPIMLQTLRDCLGTILPLKFNFPLIYRASDYCRFAEATIGQRRKKSVPRSI